MDGILARQETLDPPVDVLTPAAQQLPLVFASPHSGSDYPAEFLALSRLDPLTLRRSEDSYVDEIFGEAAAALGAPLLRARFPRAYLDPNREPFELDPAMFEEELPAFVNTRSPRVRVGLGTIARLVATGENIYAGKLRFAEAMARIDRLYRPYHRLLRELLAATRDAFGSYLLIDCHSMPSGGHGDRAARHGRTDIVLGDCHGTACHPLIMETAHRHLSAKGYAVVRNTPYAGGFTTAHYGKPGSGGHCLQIEICRALYMNERNFERKAFMTELAADMRELARALAGIDLALLAAA